MRGRRGAAFAAIVPDRAAEQQGGGGGGGGGECKAARLSTLSLVSHSHSVSAGTLSVLLSPL